MLVGFGMNGHTTKMADNVYILQSLCLTFSVTEFKHLDCRGSYKYRQINSILIPYSGLDAACCSALLMFTVLIPSKKTLCLYGSTEYTMYLHERTQGTWQVHTVQLLQSLCLKFSLKEFKHLDCGGSFKHHKVNSR